MQSHAVRVRRHAASLAAAVACVAVPAPPAAASAQAPLLLDRAGVAVAAYDGWAAWSRLDAGTGGYSLIVRSPRGAVSVAPVAERAAPFDVELGPGPGSGVAAVYSRCVDAIALTGCHLATIALGAPVPVERVLVPPGGGSDHEPAIWRGELVFLRRSGPPRARRPDELLAWTIGSGAPHTLALPRSRGNRAASWPAGLTGTLTALSFDGREVAYVTSNRVGTRGESTLWFQALGRRPLLIDQVTGGAGDTCAPAFLSPVLTGPWLYAYLHACDPSADPRLDRLTRYRHGRVQRAAHRFLRAGDEEISAAVPDGAGVAWSSEGGVQQLASVTWRAIAPPVAQSFCGRTDPFC